MIGVLLGANSDIPGVDHAQPVTPGFRNTGFCNPAEYFWRITATVLGSFL
jgi:hypothetical protein